MSIDITWLRRLSLVALLGFYGNVGAFQFCPWTGCLTPTKRHGRFGLLPRVLHRQRDQYLMSTKAFQDGPDESNKSVLPREVLRIDEECSTDPNVEESDGESIEFEGLSGEDDLHWFRFGGVSRLYEDDENPEDVILDRLRNSCVAVVGLGGVGSWTAEALCRSGIGHLVLIDLDDICISNTNRQLHTLSNNVGAMKTEAMRQRMLDIHPGCNVTLIHDFVMLDNAQEIVGIQLKNLGVDVIIDAIDGDQEKAALLAACADHGLSVVTTGSPAGKRDPTKITVDDITQVRGDNLMRACRDRLSKEFKFLGQDDKGEIWDNQLPWNIPCVYSREGVADKNPIEFGDALSSSFRCDGSMGTACFVTGTFGFVAASRVIEMIVNQKLGPPQRHSL